MKIDERETVNIITNFIREYAENCGRKRVVIGLSGGLDSSVVAKLSCMAMGNENVYAYFFPETSTPLQDFEHARLIARMLHINYSVKDISPIVHSIVKENEEMDAITLGNIKARVRMLFLYKNANLKNALVCGTSNKTELLTGYFTKYGDGGSDLMPIGDLYKTQVYQIAKYIGIPDEIIKKPPSAALWKGQTDEKELGISYRKLDKILYGLERKMSMEDIAKFADVEIKEVYRIYKMVGATEHKRRLPPIPKIGLKTVGIDWRFPLEIHCSSF